MTATESTSAHPNHDRRGSHRAHDIRPGVPETRRGDVVEELHGHRIADPYRWLEDPDSDETAAWVAAQNEVTEDFLGRLPARAAWRARLERIMRRPRAGAVWSEAGWYGVTRNDGTRPQATWYVARSLEELEAGGRVLLDPSDWSADGATSVGQLAVSPDGRLGVYAVSEGGSDWEHLRVLDMATGTRLEEPDVMGKFSDLLWLPDSRTFLYTRYDVDRTEGTSAAKLPHAQLTLHTVGTPVAEDRTMLAFPEDDQLIFWPAVSSDAAWIMVAIFRGTERRNRLWVYPTHGGTVGEPLRLVEDADAAVMPLDVVDGRLYCVTDRDAPHGRLVTYDLADPTAEPVTVIPEGADELGQAHLAGDVIVTHHLVDGSPLLTRWTRDGERLGEIDTPFGTVHAASGRPGVDELLITGGTFDSAARSVLVTPSTGERRDLALAGAGDWQAPALSVTRLRATSADGTQVPYWVVRRADLAGPRAEGPREEATGGDAGPLPTLMYGYGGFSIPITQSFAPMQMAWVEAGGAVAVANLRGGGEFGVRWYDEGRREHKQNVFDDFAAVGQDLLDRGIARPGGLAAYGGSNGGLLVGALITQHPDLVTAAAPLVGVLDMLRFHRFTGGAAWISDYGDPDVKEDFEVALAYSPLHNVREGVDYPATLVVTGDHDDRVVPSHSHKFTATMQHATRQRTAAAQAADAGVAQAGDPTSAPILTRIETSAGHGAGKSLDASIREAADVVTFLAHHVGLTPRV